MKEVTCDLRFAICDLRFAICDLRFAICDLRFFNFVIVQYCYSAFYNLPIVNLQFRYNLPLVLRLFKQFRKLLFDNMVMNKFASFNLEFSKNVNVW